jgi:hypothetical protein
MVVTVTVVPTQSDLVVVEPKLIDVSVTVVVVVTRVCTEVVVCEWYVTISVTVTKEVEEQKVSVVVPPGSLTVVVRVTKTVAVCTPFCSELELPGFGPEWYVVVVPTPPVEVRVDVAVDAVFVDTKYPATPAAATTASIAGPRLVALQHLELNAP